MSVSLEQFVDLLHESGLMSVDEVQQLRKCEWFRQAPQDAKGMSEELRRQGKLTRHQAEQLCKGITDGLVIGDYVVLDLIGAGGMGQVFKAMHRPMERVVALKLLPPAAMESYDAIKRFQREVKAVARLEHPNIVTAHDAGESNGVHYLIMQYVRSRNLRSYVKRTGALSVVRAVDYTLQAAAGLQHAHREGVIHRDIKPSNLLLESSGTIKVSDFGLALFKEETQSSGGRLTKKGQMLGTVDYMSPEQAEDTREADARSDIYSLGATLHFLLTGSPPFTGDSVGAVLMAHHCAPIPVLREDRGDVPEELDAVFQKMMAKEPDERYQTITEVIAELQKCGVPRVPNSKAAVSFGSGLGSLPEREVDPTSNTRTSDGTRRNDATVTEATVDQHTEDAFDKSTLATVIETASAEDKPRYAVVVGVCLALLAALLVAVVFFGLGR